MDFGDFRELTFLEDELKLLDDINKEVQEEKCKMKPNRYSPDNSVIINKIKNKKAKETTIEQHVSIETSKKSTIRSIVRQLINMSNPRVAYLYKLKMVAKNQTDKMADVVMELGTEYQTLYPKIKFKKEQKNDGIYVEIDIPVDTFLN